MFSFIHYRVNHQRDAYRNLQNGNKEGSNQITQDQVESLNRIKFVWSVKKRSCWDEMFQKLEAFKDTHGNCSVPIIWKVDPQLAKWCNNQKTAYKHFCKNDLQAARGITLERIKRLESLGFVWYSSRNRDCFASADTMAQGWLKC